MAGPLARFLRRKQTVIPGTDVGWRHWGGTPGSVTRRIKNELDTYGGDDAVTWVYACVSLISAELAGYPYELLNPATDKPQARPDPGLDQLLRRPNRFMTYFDLIEYLTMDLELVGNSYWLKNVRNGLGQPEELLRLRPEYVQIATDKSGRVIGYTYDVIEMGRRIPYDVDEVIHFKTTSPHSEYYGMGTIQGIWRDIDAELAQMDSVVGFFNNGARISGILTVSGALSDIQFDRLKQQFRDEYLGGENNFSVMIAEQGLEFRPVQYAPAGTGVVPLRPMEKDAILSGFGVHEFLLGGAAQSGVYKMEEAQNIFSRKMIPRARRISEKTTTDLAVLWNTKFQIDVSFAETEASRAERAGRMIAAGATINESRQVMGLPNWKDPLADIPIVPQGYAPIDIAMQANSRVGGTGGNGNGRVELPSGANVPPAMQRGAKSFTTLPNGNYSEDPDGFESLGETDAKETDPETASKIIDHRNATMRWAVSEIERSIVGVFNEQRNRTVRATVTMFVDRSANSLRYSQNRGLMDVKQIDVNRLWDEAREDDALDAVFRAVANGVADRVVKEISELLGVQQGDTRVLVNEISQLVKRINEVTRERLSDVIAEGLRRGYSVGQIATGVPEENYLGISGTFDDFTESRALTIARTEAAVLYNRAALVAFGNIGSVRVEVFDGTAHDDACREANGSIWTIEHASLNPLEHPNCARAFSPVTP